MPIEVERETSPHIHARAWEMLDSGRVTIRSLMLRGRVVADVGANRGVANGERPLIMQCTDVTFGSDCSHAEVCRLVTESPS
jgi:hypothetical protein